mmetsp:Transcript_1548/g.3192  ORF Transcript_1548/g.3192 Transcript_1548/m.3192 type:complete len:339 (-) Transcript_1548:34-1050(-)
MHMTSCAAFSVHARQSPPFPHISASLELGRCRPCGLRRLLGLAGHEAAQAVHVLPGGDGRGVLLTQRLRDDVARLLHELQSLLVPAQALEDPRDAVQGPGVAHVGLPEEPAMELPRALGMLQRLPLPAQVRQRRRQLHLRPRLLLGGRRLAEQLGQDGGRPAVPLGLQQAAAQLGAHVLGGGVRLPEVGGDAAHELPVVRHGALVLANLHERVRCPLQGLGVLWAPLAEDLPLHRRRLLEQLGSAGLLAARGAAREVGLGQLRGDLRHGPGLGAVLALPLASALLQELDGAVKLLCVHQLLCLFAQGVDLLLDCLGLGLCCFRDGSSRCRAACKQGQQ